MEISDFFNLVRGYIYIYFVFFTFFYNLICHKIYFYLRYIFRLISTFMHIYSNDVCQLNIFYVSRLNIFTLFKYFYLLNILFSHENV